MIHSTIVLKTPDIAEPKASPRCPIGPIKDKLAMTSTTIVAIATYTGVTVSLHEYRILTKIAVSDQGMSAIQYIIIR